MRPSASHSGGAEAIGFKRRQVFSLPAIYVVLLIVFQVHLFGTEAQGAWGATTG